MGRIIYYDETLTRAAPWSLCLRCRLHGEKCHAELERRELERRLSLTLLTAECPWFVDNDNGTGGKEKEAAMASGLPRT